MCTENGCLKLSKKHHEMGQLNLGRAYGSN
jgi:hypothetical protein